MSENYTNLRVDNKVIIKSQTHTQCSHWKKTKRGVSMYITPIKTGQSEHVTNSGLLATDSEEQVLNNNDRENVIPIIKRRC